MAHGPLVLEMFLQYSSTKHNNFVQAPHFDFAMAAEVLK